MKITITAQEAIERGWHVLIAGAIGLNVHAMSPDKEIILTEEQLNEMGLKITVGSEDK